MRQVDELVKLFKQEGFTLARHTNHMVWNCPCGHTRVTTPGSPGKNNRSDENTRALMRRTLRACTPTPQEDK